MLWLKHISGILGQFTSFLQKKNLFYQLFFYRLKKYLDFFVLLFTFLSTDVFNTESLNQEFFQKIGAIYLFFAKKLVFINNSLIARPST